MNEQPTVVIPGDNPPQIADSLELERLADRAKVIAYRDRPADKQEKLARVSGAQIILNSRGSVTWQADELNALPDLRLIATCLGGNRRH